MNPAGGIHCSINDFAMFARENLMGLLGKGQLLSREGYQRIHSIQVREKANVLYQGIKAKSEIALGYGWGMLPMGNEVLSVADGSAGTFYARIAIVPGLHLAFAGFSNSGDGAAALGESIRRFTGLPWSE